MSGTYTSFSFGAGAQAVAPGEMLPDRTLLDEQIDIGHQRRVA
jgi:hypothetical protein